MFHKLIDNSLSLNDYLTKNKDRPDGQQYCNGICQKFIDESFFFYRKSCCKDCFKRFEKARQMIDDRQITVDQFRADPNIVIVENTTISLKRICKTCNQDLTLDHYEAQRKECIKCRNQRKKINYKELFEKTLPVVEEVKHDIYSLTNLLRATCADVIVLLMNHYKITIKARKQNKASNVTELIAYFQSQLNPKICLGGCGFTLTEDFSVCEACKRKPRTLREEKQSDFQKNLENIVAEMEDFTEADENKYNRQQVIQIAQTLGIKFYVSWKKHRIAELIKEHFEKKKEESRIEIEKNLAKYNGELNLNGFIVESREDGMINATSLCKAGGKEFKHWKSLESTKLLLETFEARNNQKVGIPTFKALEVTVGKKGGSWIHPDLAVQMAQWISPSFALDVSAWIRELAMTGSVSLGREMTNVQLIELQKELKKAQDDHRKLLKKKSYHKFKKGPAFYIISDVDSKSVRYKPGFEGVDVSVRLQQHRSSIPGCKLEFLIYSDDSKLVETMVLSRFKSKRLVNNKEWLFEVEIGDLIKQTRTILNIVNVDYTEEENVKEYNEQISLDFSDVPKE